MKDAKWQEKCLIGSYAAVVLIFIILNVTSGQKESLLNQAINVGMLLIVLAIYVWTLRKWERVNVITQDLAQASQKIQAAYRQQEGEYLGRDFVTEETLFESAPLHSAYGDYARETMRQAETVGHSITCDLEDYINPAMISKMVSRNVMNQMPGILTGLGILGTFLGLSLGLQNFTTDSSEAIMQSIPALMDGIKVAFHTSVYGMILSLTYNYLYKRKLETAENTMDSFLDVFEEKVLPNPQNTAAGLILAYQEQQTIQMNRFAESLGRQIAEGMGDALAVTLKPQFDRLDATISRFTDIASQNQTEGLSRIVDTFVGQMNQSLGSQFSALGQAMNETYEAQRSNAYEMQQVVAQTGQVSGNMHEIAGVSQKIIEEMESYIRRLEGLQDILNQNFKAAGEQLSHTQELIDRQNTYVEGMSKAQTELAKAEQEFASLMQEQRYATKESFDGIAAHIAELDGIVQSDMTSAAQELRLASDGLSPKFMESLQKTFGMFDRNLADIENHLSATITQIYNETKRVPIVVAQSYEGMEKSLQEVTSAMDHLAASLEAQQRLLQTGGRPAARNAATRSDSIRTDNVRKDSIRQDAIDLDAAWNANRSSTGRNTNRAGE